MTSEYHPEHILGPLMELRAYQKLEGRVSEYIQEHGWSYVVEVLRRGMELEFIVSEWDIPMRKGILRDGMTALLGLEDFVFLDVEFVSSFGDLESNDLSDLRAKAKERALELAKDQVNRGVTFFMDLEPMGDTELAGHRNHRDILGKRDCKSDIHPCADYYEHSDDKECVESRSIIYSTNRSE